MISQTEKQFAASTEKPKVRVIKRYMNRKLYDTEGSHYVTLEDIAKMIRSNIDVMVIENHKKSDITAPTLMKIIFEAENKASQYPPLYILREIIQNGSGSISEYLVKLGVLTKDQLKAWDSSPLSETTSVESFQKNINQRVADTVRETTNMPVPDLNAFETPSLPISVAQAAEMGFEFENSP